MMQCSINKKLFEECLRTVGRAAARSGALPILSHIMLEVAGEEIRLFATNLELGMACTLPVDNGAANGAVTVPAHILQDIVSHMPGDKITLATDAHEMLGLQAERSAYTIHGLPASEFPVLPTINSGHSFSITEKNLLAMLKMTVFSIGTDNARQILTGARLFSEDGALSLVTTDTHRLALRVIALPRIEHPVDCVVPGAMLRELTRLLSDDCDEPVRVYYDDSRIEFLAGRMRLLSPLIAGQFPNHRNVIPADPPIALTINRAQLLDAVTRANIVAKAENCKIICRVAANMLKITAETAVVGKAAEEIAVSYEGDPIEIAFNAEYLRDALFRAIDSETIQFGYTASQSPATIRIPNRSDYVYVCMPMQIL